MRDLGVTCGSAVQPDALDESAPSSGASTVDRTPRPGVPVDVPRDGYARGASLGCPDCVTGEEHCCPFLWADAQPDSVRYWALRHMRAELSDVTAEVTR